MEKKNNCVKVGFSRILWAVMAILLCTAQGVMAQDVTQDVTVPSSTHPSPCDIDYTISGTLYVDGTANLLPGADIGVFVCAYANSKVNIQGGVVGLWIEVVPTATVKLYGTDFFLDTNGNGIKDPGEIELAEGSYSINGIVAGSYANGDPINLRFECLSGASITLAAPGGESITVNIEKAKVSWDHSDIHVYGKLYLPQGFWIDNLDPVGGVGTTLAGVEVVDPDKSVAFEIKGKDGKKWEYKDKENIDGPIKEFKIDWKGAKFDYKGDEGLHIHTHHIGGTETTLCIHCDHISGAFTVSVNGTTIAYDEEKSITTGIEYEPQKDDNTHVHFTLPFQLSPDMTIEVSGAVVLSIAVADYYEEGFVKFKLLSAFDSGLFPQGSESSPDKLECVISLGDMIAGSDLIDAEKSWTNKDDKHWDYK